MPSPKRRAKRQQRDLTFAEHFFLLTGSGDPFPTAEDAHRAWVAHRDELMARRGPDLAPFGAVAFDGDSRPFSRYQGLWPKELLCHRLAVAQRLSEALSTSRRRPSSTRASTDAPLTSSPPSRR